eukprot:CAMPEP_0182437984 /NCGR_PEP_ID=MMETSP1167-20130531/85427_1 /TAXON_ID=2988 /ORGANISM="Mallomonas Sp, Strain CCMP3275" /LENGTH=499 /DNA_ID=CAMNT_0024631117 /DNA_START=131 /DNA_END=1630 /DNA_ORIENTATION=+
MNFDEGEVREINSPRSLEACLRAGLDPHDLLAKPRAAFNSPKLTEAMVDEKYFTFERRRKEKIETVKSEREAIIQYGERMQKLNAHRTSTPTLRDTVSFEKATSTALEMEEKRLEAVRRRQEKELGKMIAREQAMVDLQVKIKRAEDEEIKKKKEHEKKVAEMKAKADKKKAKRAKELAEKEMEELARKKQLARKEAAFERKRKEAEAAANKKLMEDAKQRDIERQEKLEEHRKKTEQIMELQFMVAEQNRLKIAEREAYVKSQVELKKEHKKEELLTKREISEKRIKEALDKHHALHEEKKSKFVQSQQTAAMRAKELEALEREKLKKQADDREKKNRQRFYRLAEAARTRQEYREDVTNRLRKKDKIFEKIRAEREEELIRRNFENDLRMQELRENVDRVNRKKEFARLQTLRKIQSEDEKTERLLIERLEMQRRHKEEAKQSLQRKHAISNAMDIMRVTNDFSMLDQLFSGGKKGRHGRKRMDDGDIDDNRLAQTV